MLDSLYHYKARLDRVVDGDTIRLFIDMGFRTQTTSVPCRLYGLDTPELNSTDDAERTKARDAKDYVSITVGGAAKILVKSERLDKYGRPLVTVFYRRDAEEDWHNLNQELLAKHLAVPYMGDD